MKKIRTCKNKCIFCFVDQLPKNLRSTLYIKDDDYFLSCSNGNFITLTNLTTRDLERIIKFRIEPLYVSLHSFNTRIRDLIFGNKKSDQALKNFKILDGNGIRTNIQIVLCPGINDGQDLKYTLDTLITKYKKVISVGIVPVGITRFNCKRNLKPFNIHSSREVIGFIDTYRSENCKNRIASKIFLADEFFILAKKDFPGYGHYGRFLQIRNGIGKTANFFCEIEKAVRRYKPDHGSKDYSRKKVDLIGQNKSLLVTSEYGKYIFKYVIDLVSAQLCEFIELDLNRFLDILTVKNNFFGGNVKVTGLLTGNDIICALKKQGLKKYGKILVPDCIFNNDGLTLDNMTQESINKVDPRIKLIGENGKDLIKTLFS